jgi:hypothetical protein
MNVSSNYTDYNINDIVGHVQSGVIDQELLVSYLQQLAQLRAELEKSPTDTASYESVIKQMQSLLKEGMETRSLVNGKEVIQKSYLNAALADVLKAVFTSLGITDNKIPTLSAAKITQALSAIDEKLGALKMSAARLSTATSSQGIIDMSFIVACEKAFNKPMTDYKEALTLTKEIGAALAELQKFHSLINFAVRPLDLPKDTDAAKYYEALKIELEKYGKPLPPVAFNTLDFHLKLEPAWKDVLIKAIEASRVDGTLKIDTLSNGAFGVIRFYGGRDPIDLSAVKAAFPLAHINTKNTPTGIEYSIDLPSAKFDRELLPTLNMFAQFGTKDYSIAGDTIHFNASADKGKVAAMVAQRDLVQAQAYELSEGLPRIRDKLAEMLAKLSQLSPDIKKDTNAMYSTLEAVYKDLVATIGTGKATVAGVSAWVLDAYDNNDLSKGGKIQDNIGYAISGVQETKETQIDLMRKSLSVYEMFIKLASSVIESQKQIGRSLTKGIAG